MIGAIEPEPYEVVGNVTNFYTHHPTPENRRRYALGLLPVDGRPAIDTNLPTYTVLAAHWADNLDEHRRTGRLLFSLYPTLVGNRGQSVLRLSGCEPHDITAEDTDRLAGATIEIGTLDKYSEPEYGYRPTPRYLLPSLDVQDATYLDYQISTSVREGTTISIDQAGSVDLEHPPEPSRKDVALFTGSVCLENDVELYDRTKWSSESELVFGNANALFLVRKLMTLVGGPAHTKLERLVRRGKISSATPLPNLINILS